MQLLVGFGALAGIFLSGLVALLVGGAPYHNIFLAIRIAYFWCTILFPLIIGGLGLIVWTRWRPMAIQFTAVAALCVLARIYATHIEPNLLFTREVVIETPKVTEEVRILHLSDLQSDGIDGNEERAFARIRALHPDLLISTGDLLQAPVAVRDQEFDKAIALFATVDAPQFDTNGDTDGYVRTLLNSGKAPPLQGLEGESALVDIKGAKIRIHGLSLQASRYAEFTDVALAGAVSSLEPSEFTIVAGHAPDFILRAKEHAFDLCLAGHTHGGQIRIPFLGPIITMSSVPRHLARGFHEVGETRLNVSAGVGAEHAAGLPSIRVFCPPEVTLIRLVPPGTAPVE